MKQALWAAAPGFAGACLIDEISLTEPNIPTFVRQSSQQCQLQGWENRKVSYKEQDGIQWKSATSKASFGFGFFIMKASSS